MSAVFGVAGEAGERIPEGSPVYVGGDGRLYRTPEKKTFYVVEGTGEVLESIKGDMRTVRRWEVPLTVIRYIEERSRLSAAGVPPDDAPPAYGSVEGGEGTGEVKKEYPEPLTDIAEAMQAMHDAIPTAEEVAARPSPGKGADENVGDEGAARVAVEGTDPCRGWLRVAYRDLKRLLWKASLWAIVGILNGFSVVYAASGGHPVTALWPFGFFLLSLYMLWSCFRVEDDD